MGNIEANIRNLTQAVELMAPIEERSYHDFAAVGDWGCNENTVKTWKYSKMESESSNRIRGTSYSS